ncbi:hypothetical protein MTO96_021957 [Rhipicephalus appendiculatus]
MQPHFLNNEVDANARDALDGGGQPLVAQPEEIPANRGAAPSGAQGASSVVAVPSPLTPLTPLDKQAAVDPKQFRRALDQNEARELRQRQRDVQQCTYLLYIVCAFACVVTTLTLLAMAVFEMSEPGPVTDDGPLPPTTRSNDSRDNVDRRLREAVGEVVEPWQATCNVLINNASTEGALLADRSADGEIA